MSRRHLSPAEIEAMDAIERARTGAGLSPRPAAPRSEPLAARLPDLSDAAPVAPRAAGRAIACETCAWWCPPTRPLHGRDVESDAQGRLGQCRRFPPVTEMTERGRRAIWPLTIAAHWCGEHGVVEG